MKQRQNINLQLPIFSWLFFLFLSSGISYYHNNLQFGKPVQIERIDQLNSNNRRKVVAFSVITQKSNLYQKLNSQYLLIKLLSDRLENSVQIILNRQTCLFQKLLQTTILHFRSLSQASNSSDDLPGSIS